MADEITYDRVEEAEEKILGAINGVGDTVNGLPASLETDFTEVKNAIADVKTDVGNVNTAVSDVKSDTSSIKNTVDTNPLLSYGSAVKSVQSGVNKVSFSASKESVVSTINDVNVEKSVLIINNLASDTTMSFYIKGNNEIVGLAHSQLLNLEVSWHVIEFF